MAKAKPKTPKWRTPLWPYGPLTKVQEQTNRSLLAKMRAGLMRKLPTVFGDL